MGKNTERFELTIRVDPADIDQQNHVNNVVYLRWVQDVAAAHWFKEASEDEQKAVMWVVVRHEIDYKHPALLGDQIIARTWVGSASQHAFERHTELVRASDNRLLARASSIWCPIDARTGKPADVSDEFRAKFSVQEQDTQE
jgi:acyl-CoA thioester hydrolase